MGSSEEKGSPTACSSSPELPVRASEALAMPDAAAELPVLKLFWEEEDCGNHALLCCGLHSTKT